MYDASYNNSLNEEEVFRLINALVKANELDDKTEEEVRQLSSNFFVKMDAKKTGNVDLQDFLNVALNSPFIKNSLTCVIAYGLEG